MKSKTFCIAPWVHSCVNSPDATFSPCCTSLLKTNYKNHNEWWNSIDIQNLRFDIANNKKNPNCSVCWTDEAVGKPSLRQNYNKLFSNFANRNAIKQSVQNNFVVNDTPKTLDLRLGNICNLKCIMCSPLFSDKIADEAELNKQVFNILPEYTKTLQILPLIDNDWIENTEINFQEIMWLKLQGGEPLAYKYIHTLLDKLNRDCTLALTTNGTAFTKNIINKLSKLKKVEISISIEAANTANNVIRYNSNWNEIKDNIEKLLSVNTFEVQINHVLQITSILFLPEIIKFCEERNLHLNIIKLDQPKALHISGIPDQLKEKFLKDIKQLNITIGKNTYIKSFLYDIMQKTQFSLQTYKNFVKYVEYLDSIRPQKLHPYIKEILAQ